MERFLPYLIIFLSALVSWLFDRTWEKCYLMVGFVSVSSLFWFILNIGRNQKGPSDPEPESKVSRMIEGAFVRRGFVD